MRVVVGEGRREPVVASIIVVSSLMLLAGTVLLGVALTAAVPVLAGIVLLAVAHRWLLAWPTLVALTVLTILFVPIKRYTLPAGLPFHLELYRLLVAFVIVAWVTALLIDPRVRLRASGFEAPIFAFLIVILLGLIANADRVNPLESVVVKAVTFFVSFVLLFYLLVSLVRRPADIDFIIRILLAGGAVLGVMAIVESSTGYNVFNHLSRVVPVLKLDASQVLNLHRGGRLRVYGSGQHPIAFGAALMMLVPLGVYRAQAFGRQWRWWLATVLILMGALSTRSRTATTMMLAIVVVYILLRPLVMKRLWPAVLPFLIVVHFALPGTIGSIRASFFPKGGLIAQQTNTSVGSGRIATLGPALDSEFTPNPILGEGFGTRITGRPDPGQPPPNGPILDDAWLGVLIETGIVGTAALVWLFLRGLRTMGGAGKRDPTPRGWLLVAATASIAAYAVGMFTYDSFSFIQVTFLLFITLGIGASALLSRQHDWERFADSG